MQLMQEILRHVSSFFLNSMVQKLISDFEDNERFTIDPAVVTYPTSSNQVAQVVQVGAAFDYNVIARSGGVCLC